MTDVIDREAGSNSAPVGVSDARLQELVDQARADGLQLTGVASIRMVYEPDRIPMTGVS